MCTFTLISCSMTLFSKLHGSVCSSVALASAMPWLLLSTLDHWQTVTVLGKIENYWCWQKLVNENSKTFAQVHCLLIVVVLQLCTETCNAQTQFVEMKCVTQCTIEFISWPDRLTFDLARRPQRCGTVCLNSFSNWTSPSDNSNDRWKRLCLVNMASAPVSES